jgi:UDP-N-acetylmuramate dehydrogenase
MKDERKMATLDTYLAEDIRKTVRGIVKPNEPMAKHTTFGIGGPADVYIEPADADDLAAVITWANANQVPWFVFGDGANLLVSDKGIRGIVIRTGKPFMKAKFDGDRVTVGSGAKLDKIVSLTVNAGLGGLENAAGIPGTIGGAIVMNAGTYRGQIGDVVEIVRVVTCEGKQLDMTPDDLQFKYRWSVFQTDKSKIIVESVLKLVPGNKEELVRTAENIRRRRNVNLPTVGRSAGCVFKNPDGHSAGQLIDEAGLKGTRCGDALVADKHANFILNMGNASAADVHTLAEQVRTTIKQKFDIDLNYEVRIVGDW